MTLPPFTEQSPPPWEDAILEASDFLCMPIPEKRTFLQPWMQEQSIVLITGWRGIGKTWFALFALNAITRGVALGTWPCTEAVPCLYLDGEMAAIDIQNRLRAIGTSERKPAPLHIYSDAFASSLNLPRANLLSPEWRDRMKEILLEKEIKLWAIDNISALAPGIDENSKQEWDPISRWLLDLRFAGISTVLLHHEGKKGEQRGTSAREDALDISISLQKPSDYTIEDGARFIVRFSKHRIASAYLPLIADTEFQVNTTSGRATYKWKRAKRDNKFEVLTMLDAEVPAKDIAKALAISAGRVSQIKGDGIKDAFLSPEGKLTPLGREKYAARTKLDGLSDD
ncbi:MAG: AAA family ATPase [Syntrophobacteraceae bacterium]